MRKFLYTLLLIPGIYCFNSQGQDWKTRLDKPALEWSSQKKWINSTPLTLEGLKGRVVLLRWWTDRCPYCEASSYTLNEFYEVYRDQGLEIIGMYHPKPARKANTEVVKEFAAALGFVFPIAIDEDWEALNTYWLDGPNSNFTSISYLIDKEGSIRYIHPGGSYNKDAMPFNDSQWKNDYYVIKAKIEELLAEEVSE